MPLLVSPRIQPWVQQIVAEFFSARKSYAEFWHSAFKQFFYKSTLPNGEPLFIIFTGYGQLPVAAAVIYEYHRLFEKHETNPRAFFIGSCVAVTQFEGNLNDIIIPTRAFTKSISATEIASRFLKDNPSRDPWRFDTELISKVQRIAIEKKIKIFQGGVYSHETFFEDFWMSFETDWGVKKGYICGDYECASFVASCNYIGVPMLALLHVTDTRKSGSYVEVSREEKVDTLRRLLNLLQSTVIS